MAYLIAIDETFDDRESVEETLNSLGTHKRFVKNVWVLETENKAREIKEKLKEPVSVNHKYVVLKVGRDGSWNLPNSGELESFLARNLD